MDRRFQNTRRSIRLETFDYSSSGAYFVTICAQARGMNWFGVISKDGMRLNAAGNMVKNELEGLTTRFTNLEVDTFIVMPDHVHAVLVLGDSNDQSEPHIRRGELHVRPATNAERDTTTHQRLDALHANESTRGVRAVKGEHTVRPYEATAMHHHAYTHPKGTRADSVGRIVQLFKTFTTQEYIKGVRRLGWQPFEKHLWQRDYWERVIRDDRELEETRSYILENPARRLEVGGAL
jgi:REP element-mobilizing transposase RayT